MRLISLNTWGCRISAPVFDYIKNYSDSADIFCFQEILKGGNGKTHRGEVKSAYEDIERLLPQHVGYFSEYGDGGYYSENSRDLDFKYGIASYISKNLNQSYKKGITLVDPAKAWSDYSGRFAAGATLSINADKYNIINVHGLWQGSIKGDTEAKIDQSKKILELGKESKGLKIICGDFNLLPETESIRLLEDKYRNLIEEFGIKDTRGSLYTKELRFSDYVFTDKSIIVKDFSVPNISVSDHLPLVIELN